MDVYKHTWSIRPFLTANCILQNVDLAPALMLQILLEKREPELPDRGQYVQWLHICTPARLALLYCI
jgi:hypothetical protein